MSFSTENLFTNWIGYQRRVEIVVSAVKPPRERERERERKNGVAPFPGMESLDAENNSFIFAGFLISAQKVDAFKYLFD